MDLIDSLAKNSGVVAIVLLITAVAGAETFTASFIMMGTVIIALSIKAAAKFVAESVAAEFAKHNNNC